MSACDDLLIRIDEFVLTPHGFTQLLLTSSATAGMEFTACLACYSVTGLPHYEHFSCVRLNLNDLLLDFAENYVDICSGDILAVDDVAVLADLCKVLAVHLLSCGLSVSMDCKLLEGGLHLRYRHRCLSHTGRYRVHMHFWSVK